MKTKSAGLAVVLNAIVPGAGHVYVEKYYSAIWYLLLYFVAFPVVRYLSISYVLTHLDTATVYPFGIHPLFAVIIIIIWAFGLYSVYIDANNYNAEAQAESKKCPHCAEYIKAEAAICRYCRQPV